MPRTTTAARDSRCAPLKQIARETGIPYTTLRDRVLDGQLPVVRIGRALYLRRADVDRWIDSHTERFAS